MDWLAVVPLKRGAERKSRLSPRLSLAERALLSERMAAHVIATLSRVEAIREIILLSPEEAPPLPARWAPDRGTGLNAELGRLHVEANGRPLVVIHGDLPMIAAEDVAALIGAAGQGAAAIAPDRHGAGTNALALAAPPPFGFAFGADSFARHLAAGGADAVAVRRWRLSLDVDTPADLDEALRLGFVP